MVELNEDVISVICSNLIFEEDLLNLSLTSKTFLEPALDCLWRAVGGDLFRRILCILPETVVVDGKKMLVGPIAPESLKRVEYYTSRIHTMYSSGMSMSLSDQEGHDVHPAVFLWFSSLEKPLLPNLQHLSIHAESSLPYLALFSSLFGHKLRRLHFDPTTRDYDLGPVLSFILRQFSTVEQLYIWVHRCTNIASSLQMLTQLKTLSVAISPQHLESSPMLIRDLCLLPELEVLSLEGLSDSGDIPLNAWHFQIPEQSFARLTALDISIGTSASAVGRTLDLIPINQLKSISILTSLDESLLQAIHQEDNSFFAKLVQRCQSSLTSLKFENFGTGIRTLHDDDDTNAQGWEYVLRSVCKLSSLQKVTANYPLPLDDASIQMMAQSWPNLTSLHIRNPEMAASIQSLAHFAQHCPRLDELHIPLAVDIDIPFHLPGSLYSHKLSLIGPIGRRKPKSPPIVARHLDRLFPFVEIDNMLDSEDMTKSWQPVNDILLVCRQARMERQDVCRSGGA